MKFIFSTLLIILSIILFFWIVNPLHGKVSQLQTEVLAYNTALDNSTSLQKTQDKLVSDYKNISQDDRTRLEHFLPNTVNNIQFILEIERIANLHGMPISDIKFQQQQPTNTTPQTTNNNNSNTVSSSNPADSLPYGSFPVEFTTEGDYNSFVSFLKDVEHNLRLVDIKSISFTVPTPTKDTAGSNPNIYTYDLKVQIYWLK